MEKVNLNKENFWNEVYEKYPKAVQVFCDWIDEYKKKNNWKALFYNVGELQTIKFHDIPLAMQLGGFIQYVLEKDEGDVFEIDDFSTKGIGDLIRNHFIYESSRQEQ